MPVMLHSALKPEAGHWQWLAPAPKSFLHPLKGPCLLALVSAFLSAAGNMLVCTVLLSLTCWHHVSVCRSAHFLPPMGQDRVSVRRSAHFLPPTGRDRVSVHRSAHFLPLTCRDRVSVHRSAHFLPLTCWDHVCVQLFCPLSSSVSVCVVFLSEVGHTLWTSFST